MHPRYVWQDHLPQHKTTLHTCLSKAHLPIQLIIALSFFIGKAFTVFEAGLALNTHGSLVKGFTPLRAGFAGVFFNFKFKEPQNLKEPFFFIWSAAIPTRASTAPFTSFGLQFAVSATARYAADAVITFDPPAFIAVAFIAFMAFDLGGGNISAKDGAMSENCLT